MFYESGPQFVAFLLGVLAGCVPLLVGVAIGIWLNWRPGGSRRSRDSAARHARELVRGLFLCSSKLSNDVGESRAELDEINRHIDKFGETGNAIAPAVVEILAQMSQSNGRLRQRLNTAEVTLKRQSGEIAAYLSESRTDALTGLPNRRALDEHISRQIARHRGGQGAFAIALIDIDHFKSFNDLHGHLAGDDALQCVANSIERAGRDGDTVARFGGEEFAIVLPATDVETAAALAEKARLAVEHDKVTMQGKVFPITISSGVAVVAPGEDESALLNRADASLYAAKAAGRNSVHYHDGETIQQYGTRSRENLVPENSESVLVDNQLNTPSDAEARSISHGLSEACHELRDRLREVASDKA